MATENLAFWQLTPSERAEEEEEGEFLFPHFPRHEKRNQRWMRPPSVHPSFRASVCLLVMDRRTVHPSLLLLYRPNHWIREFTQPGPHGGLLASKRFAATGILVSLTWAAIKVLHWDCGDGLLLLTVPSIGERSSIVIWRDVQVYCARDLQYHSRITPKCWATSI